MATLVAFGWPATAGAADREVWTLDDPARVAGRTTQVQGSPTARNAALEFDGIDDGVTVPVNPIAGCREFTIQVLLRPDAGGGAEQRFFHVEDGSGWRALLELRLDEAGRWWLDTFLGSAIPGTGLALIDPDRKHPTGRYHWVALTYDGETMSGYVNGVLEARGTVKWGPMREGRTSLGVRLNQVSWYKGAIRRVEIAPEALPPERLNRLP